MTEVVHSVTGAFQRNDGTWFCDTLCGRTIPEGPVAKLDDVRDRLCPDCETVAEIYRRSKELQPA